MTTDDDTDDGTITRSVMRMVRGDEAALRQLVTDHLPWIEAHVRKRLSAVARRDGDTQDYVQEALLDVLRDGPHFAIDDVGAFRGLLARIVENNLIDRVRYLHREQRDYRRQKPMPTDSVLQLDAPQRSVTEPPTAAGRTEQQHWLRLAVELLEPDDREVIRLRDWEGLSFPELGKRFAISEDAARKRYDRALPRLAEKLDLLRRGQWRGALPASPG